MNSPKDLYCCTDGKHWKHDFKTRTFVQTEGKFKGELILEKKCTKCRAKFETLFERAINLTTINLD